MREAWILLQIALWAPLRSVVALVGVLAAVTGCESDDFNCSGGPASLGFWLLGDLAF